MQKTQDHILFIFIIIVFFKLIIIKKRKEGVLTRKVMILGIGKTGHILESRIDIIQTKQIELRYLLHNKRA